MLVLNQLLQDTDGMIHYMAICRVGLVGAVNGVMFVKVNLNAPATVCVWPFSVSITQPPPHPRAQSKLNKEMVSQVPFYVEELDWLTQTPDLNPIKHL